MRHLKFLISFLILVMLCYSCKVVSVTGIVPPRTSIIPYEKFEATVSERLISPAFGLTITYAVKDTLEAEEIYSGQTHQAWFIGSTVWKEKTTYRIVYKRDVNGTKYSLERFTTEAPNEKFEKWRPCLPSKKTKEYQIIKAL